MGTAWECIKAVDVNGVEFEVNDRVQFSIDGTDSTFTRISNYNPLTGLNPNEQNDTIVGSWTWAYALEGNLNKQIIQQTNPGKNLRIISLSKKVFVFQDQSNDNTIYHYVPL